MTRRTQIMVATMRLGKFDCMGDTEDAQILRELAHSCGHIFRLESIPVEGYAPILRMIYREPNTSTAQVGE